MTNATLNVEGKEISFPVLKGTLGSDVVDIASLNKHDIFTLDSGFMSTAACKSAITFIDGDKGILLYRGYPIDQLADQCDFMEVSSLLLFGELPNSQQKNQFEQNIKENTFVPESIFHLFEGFSKEAHPMAMLLAAVSALYTYHQTTLDTSTPEGRSLATIALIAKIPVLAALCYRRHIQKPFIAPDTHTGYAQNFLQMLFSDTHPEIIKDPVLVRAMDKIFTLHADHEQNASTSAVRIAGSTGANPFACISAGIGTLWGPAHGGANEACLNMLKEIGDESQIEHYIARAKDKNDPFRLMGFGHRVYKNYDPRAKVMRATCHEVLNTLNIKDNPLFKLALKLEKIALEDNYFIERKLYPNVDFYSGLTLNALGIPINMFTVIFALARTTGWMAHWTEMLNDPNHKLARPRQLYIGQRERKVTHPL